MERRLPDDRRMGRVTLPTQTSTRRVREDSGSAGDAAGSLLMGTGT